MTTELRRLDPLGNEVVVTYNMDASPNFASVGVNLWSASVSTNLPADVSGWYRARPLFISSSGTSGTILAKVVFAATVQVDEFTDIATGFVCDSTFVELPPIGRRYWLHGSSLLASFRSPELVAAGSIFAANTSSTYRNISEILATGLSEMLSKVPLKELHNGTDGTHIKDGFYGWEKPFTRQTTLLETSCSSVSGTVQSPVGYVIPSPGCFDGGFVVYFDPTTASTDAVLGVRFECCSLIGYQPRTKLIKATRPVALTGDQWDTVLFELRSVPNFSTNDWHTMLRSVAGKVATVAKYALAAAELGVGLASPGAFTKIAALVRGLGQMV
jgi:hypothetical protein